MLAGPAELGPVVNQELAGAAARDSSPLSMKRGSMCTGSGFNERAMACSTRLDKCRTLAGCLHVFAGRVQVRVAPLMVRGNARVSEGVQDCTTKPTGNT